MSATAVTAVLAAAVLHAVWNALAHGIEDRWVGFSLIGVAATVFGVVVTLTLGLPPSRVWPYVVGSASVHVLYMLMLMLSYRHGEFSQVYPLARGTSPWLVALVSLTVLGLDIPAVELAGVLVISAGLIGLVLVGGRPRRHQLPGLAAAVGTGVLIATYTVVDGLAVRHTDVLLYAGWLFLLQGPVIPLLAVAVRGRRIVSQARPWWWLGLTGGAVSLLAYGLVLWAQQSGALAAVAALRETSIVVGALLGAVFLGERLGRGRAVASAVVVLGVVLVNLA
jgi:drug/metabolite transporter (DMT)-like permease